MSQNSGVHFWSQCGAWLGFSLIAVSPLAALDPTEKPANYSVAHWDTENGLPHNAIKQLFQSRNGYLWVGTNYGLARFDGQTFTVFNKNNTPEFRDNQITTLAETRDGSLWIGTGDGLLRFRENRFSRYDHTSGLKSMTVNTVCEAPDGSLWIGGREGVSRWVDGKIVNDITLPNTETIGMRNITADAHGAMWLAFGTGVLRYQNGAFTSFGTAEGLPAQQIQLVSSDAEGHTLAVTQNGLFRLERDRFVPAEQNTALSSLSLSRTLLDRAGNLWVGSVGGLDRYYKGQVVPCVDRVGHKLGVVDTILEDREGCLWVGSSEGLYRFADRRAYSLSQDEGVPGNLVNAVRQTRDGSLWISSWGAGVVRLQNGTTTRYITGAPLSWDNVTCVYEAPDGTMWFGNRVSSLDRMENGKVTNYVYPSGVASSRPVTALLMDDRGVMLIGIGQRGLLQLQDGQIIPVPEAANMSGNRTTVWALHKTRDGRLLMGTSIGLYERKADLSWQPIVMSGLAGPVMVRNILEEADGSLWLATDGYGLVRWENGRARSYGSRVGLLDDTLFNVLSDESDALWVSSTRGISRIRKSELLAIDHGTNTVVNSLTLGRVDGLLSASSPGNGSPDAVRLPDGRLMFATDNGVAVLEPDRLKTNELLPPLYVEHLVVNGTDADLSAPVIVPPGTNDVQIHYTAISLLAPERVRFKIRLAPLDRDWVDSGGRRDVRYAKLPPGDYTFRAIACNNDGVWNAEGVSVNFTVQPFFYQNGWFIGLSALALVAAALGTYWARVNRVRRQMTVLAGLVEQRTGQLQSEVTERKRVADALQSSEAFLHSLIQQLPVNIFRKDASDHYVFVNSRFCQAKGKTAEQILGQTPFDIVSRPAAEVAHAEHEVIMRTGQSIEKEEASTQPDGTTQYLQVVKSPVIAADGKIIGTQGIQFDITQRKLAEEQVRKLSTAIEQSPVSIIITNLAGNIEYTNPKFSEVTGYSAAEAKGRNPRILKSGQTPMEEYRKLWQVLVSGGTWTGEFHNQRKNGELYWEEATISPIRDASGRVTHYLAVKEDITSRKQVEQELKSAKITAEAAARAKSEFLANMSHEIRTPMNGVIGMTGLLLDTKLDAQQLQFAESVKNSAENLMVVINDILDFSKIEAGKLTFEQLDFDLLDTIEDTLEMLAARAQSKGLELINMIASEVPTGLRGDPGRLRQILTNLLGNALKFTERGEVVLRVGLERETATHAVVRFQVVDTGIGISREARERLFQSFQQADNSTTRKYGGTGLGLAISKQLVGLMHGEIGVESEPGKGSTFWFTAEFEKQTGGSRPERNESPASSSLRVLVVDDNATNRQILAHQLVTWKMQKGSAAGGVEALKMLRAAVVANVPYDVALLDMQMPEMDGLTLARAIKNDPALAPTHLLMLTSLGQSFTQAELRATGLEAYLVKPVRKSRLFDTIVNVVGGLPTTSTPAEAPPPIPDRHSASNPATPPLRVLVAEDNQVNQKIAAAQLKKLGCTIDLVANGLEVLDALARVDYHVVFMDCQMPEMDGYEATRTIRQREQDRLNPCRWKAPIHIIAVTANAMQGDREKCLAVGMDDYVSKPVQLTELKTALDRWRAAKEARTTPSESVGGA